MALIKCPECCKDISDKSPQCIYCGYPLANELKKQSNDESSINLNKRITTTETQLEHGKETVDEKTKKCEKHPIGCLYIASIAIFILFLWVLQIKVLVLWSHFGEDL